MILGGKIAQMILLILFLFLQKSNLINLIVILKALMKQIKFIKKM